MSDDVGDSRPRQLVHAARERMQQARNQVWSDRTDGSVSRETRRQFIVSLLAYRDVLADYRDDSALKHQDGWEGYDVDWPLDYLQQYVTVSNPSKDPRGGRDTTREPAILHVPIDDLIDVSKKLDEIAVDLGFSAETKRSRDQYHIANPDAQEHPEPVNDNVPKPGQQR